MTDEPKARTLANGIEVWCSYEKLVPVGELKPNPRNPNTHPQRQIELLAKSIRYFGWRQNISVSKLTGFIVAGHGRLMAAIFHNPNAGWDHPLVADIGCVRNVNETT